MAAVCGEAKGPLHKGKATVRGPHGILGSPGQVPKDDWNVMLVNSVY